MSTMADTLRTWARHEVVEDRRARSVIWLAAFVLATALGAHVAVPLPLTPVPMTLQVLFVILAGAVLGPWLGAAAMVTYLVVGAAGIPVFASIGLLAPSGGYLLAMPAAAFVTGCVAGPGRSRVRLLAGLVAGVLVIYVGGVAQLFLLTRQDPSTLLALGVLPFVGVDATKVVVAFIVAGPLRRRVPGREA